MKFPEKLWAMVDECTSGAIQWGDDGKTIFIDYCKFETEFLGENSGVFKTKNIVSFIRQLNLYGFRKCSRYNDVHEFRNPYFIRGRHDLLKCMRRKLGYTLDVISPIKEGNTNLIANEDKKIYNPYKRKLSKNGPIPETATQAIPPMYNLQDLNSVPYGWWGNGYHPMSSMYALNNCQSPKEECGSVKIKEEKVDTDDEAKDGYSYWRNLDMLKNVIFVPIPAQYGMYPGLFNANFPLPFAAGSPQEDGKTATARKD